jgi:signal transduction histidine kinase
MRLAKYSSILTGSFAAAALMSLLAWQFLAARHATILESSGEAVQEYIAKAGGDRRLVLDGVNPELLLSEMALPRTHLYRYSDIEALKRLADHCQSFPSPPPELRKAVQYHQGVCDGVVLPEDSFFDSGPTMHPAGISFALMALQKNDQLSNAVWVKNREKQFHIRELSKIPTTVQLSEPFQSLRFLDESAIKSLEYGFVTILDHKKVLIQDLAKSQQMEFMIFERRDWDRYFSLRGTRPVNFSNTSHCGMTRYDLCLEQSPLIGYLTWLCTIFSGLTLLLMTARWYEMRRMIGIRAAEELQNRKTMISILSHELRTPVASIGLNIEVLRREFSRFSDDMQDAVLRLFADANRLQRIIRGSEDFLRASTSQDTSATPKTSVSLGTILDQMRDHYQFSLRRTDGREFTVSGTREWVEICIRNILENASRHGKGEVKVSVTEESGSVVVEISDSGEWVDKGADALKPFQRSEMSQGMGLGLYVTRELMRQMDGDLIIQTNPTRVRLQWPI